MHNNTVRHFCPHGYCRDALKLEKGGWWFCGFNRKDNWLKHLRAGHKVSQKEVKALKEKEIPTVVLKDHLWSVVSGTSADEVTDSEVRPGSNADKYTNII